jgi:hypothetical protein
MPTEVSELDVYDGRILAELQRDARITRPNSAAGAPAVGHGARAQARAQWRDQGIRRRVIISGWERHRAVVRVGRVEYARVVS